MKSLKEAAFSEIRDFVRRDVKIFKPETVISEIFGFLLETNSYEALIKSNRIIGVISIRDLLGIVQPRKTTLRGRWFPSRSVSPSELVVEVSHEIIKHNIRALPVIESDVVLGIISQVELIETLDNVKELTDIYAKEFMKTSVINLDVNDNVASARRLMLDQGFSHVPVTCQDKLVGIVTAKKLTETFINLLDSETIVDRIGEKPPRKAGLLKDIMDTSAFIASPKTSALEIITTLKERKVNACIITNEEAHILGIITPREVLSIIIRYKPEGTRDLDKD
jgi:CBS domain-containing protein